MQQPDIFYKVDSKYWEELTKEAQSESFELHIDQKNASESWSRRSSNLTFKEALATLNEKVHYIFIHRREYFPFQKEHIETGFSTMDRDDNVLVFIKVSIERLDYYIKKYKMKPIN